MRADLLSCRSEMHSTHTGVQPAHSHSQTLSFKFLKQCSPVVVDADLAVDDQDWLLAVVDLKKENSVSGLFVGFNSSKLFTEEKCLTLPHCFISLLFDGLNYFAQRMDVLFPATAPLEGRALEVLWAVVGLQLVGWCSLERGVMMPSFLMMLVYQDLPEVPWGYVPV